MLSTLPAVPLSLHDLTQWLSPDFLLSEFGTALFWIGIVVLFVECGLLFPFLPGDTLLFAMGLFIAESKVDIIPGNHLLDLVFAMGVYIAAAFAGNVTGYLIGRKVGPSIYHRDGKVIKRKYLDQTSAFFERHGHSALVAGRFVPFVRTYITLVAGVTKMKQHVFYVWSAIGAVAWVVSLMVLGYVLGQTFPGLGKYIDLVTYGLLGLTVVALFVEFLRKRKEEDPGLPEAYRDEESASN